MTVRLTYHDPTGYTLHFVGTAPWQWLARHIAKRRLRHYIVSRGLPPTFLTRSSETVSPS